MYLTPCNDCIFHIHFLHATNFLYKPGFIQALTDLHLTEAKTQIKLSFETQSFKPKIKK